MLKNHIELFHLKNNSNNYETKVTGWFKDFFNFGSSLTDTNNDYAIIIVVPNKRFIGSLISAGYIFSYYNETAIKEEDNNAITQYLNKEESINKKYLYIEKTKKTKEIIK